jgi:4-amino-4-deoxy-L-arabinose transferase-like glycosyltransferase
MRVIKEYRWLLIVWACFLVRGIFYCSVLPLWEGFDEWAHFAVAQNMVTSGRAVIDRNAVVSQEINASLQLAPLPRGMTLIVPPSVIRDAYWQLPLAERTQREQMLRNLTPQSAFEPTTATMPAYEASQPPLYYWLIALPLSAFGHTSLLTRVWLLRGISLLLGSLAIPIGFLLARKVFSGASIALGLTAFVALMPELAINLARVSNESLGITLYTCLLLAVCHWIEQPASLARAMVVGVALGLGLLTKAYFLTAVPAVAVLYAHTAWEQPRHYRRWITNAVLSLLIAFALAGWWYVRNYLQTGTVSGLDEAVMLKHVGFAQKVTGAFAVHWPQAFATILLSHLWYGSWSLLALPRWLYYVIFGYMIIPLSGLVIARRSLLRPRLFCLLSIYGCFWLGQAYQVVMLFVSKGSSTAMGGWYLYSVVWVEVILCTVGIFALVPIHFRQSILTGSIVGVAVLDLYALHFIALPYYAHVNSLSSPDLTRLLINQPPFLSFYALFSIWALFLLSTGVIVAVGVYALRQEAALANAYRLLHD